jgi:hypothetical protein
LNSPDRGNIEKIKIIMNVIGSPFDYPKNKNIDPHDTMELYNIAKKNKIGLFFLESLAKIQMIGGLSTELEKQREKYIRQRITTKRAAYVLNTTQCKYAIVKSNFPFPTVPNDVDLLILGGNEEYRSAIKSMKSNYFKPVGPEAPLEICLHDTTRAEHNGAFDKFAVKDEFDVDVYKEIGAGHIIYMNKKRLINQISEISIDNTIVNILNVPSEIALGIFHSIYPERLYTLLLHFHILYTIKGMNSRNVDDFLQICDAHKIRNAALIALSLTEIIQEFCFGKSPSKVTDLRECLGKQKQIKIDRMPYLYPMRAVFDSFWGKRKDLVFTISVIRQMISMLNPRYLMYVAKIYQERNIRDTY